MATDGHVELLIDNGTIIGTATEGFAKLKALTFDNVRHRFIVSDMDEYDNDTIYAIDLTKETDNNPIIADLPDDVQVSASFGYITYKIYMCRYLIVILFVYTVLRRRNIYNV